MLCKKVAPGNATLGRRLTVLLYRSRTRSSTPRWAQVALGPSGWDPTVEPKGLPEAPTGIIIIIISMARWLLLQPARYFYAARSLARQPQSLAQQLPSLDQQPVSLA